MSEAKKTETKTDIPRIPEFNPFTSFDPMAYWTTTQQAFQKMIGDAYDRAQTFAEQYAALEKQMVVRAQGAVSNWAQLTQDAIAYGAQLSAEARKIAFETGRKMSVGA
jgi:hypothetical protein